MRCAQYPSLESMSPNDLTSFTRSDNESRHCGKVTGSTNSKSSQQTVRADVHAIEAASARASEEDKPCVQKTTVRREKTLCLLRPSAVPAGGVGGSGGIGTKMVRQTKGAYSVGWDDVGSQTKFKHTFDGK